MLPSFLRKMFLGLAALAFFAYARCAHAESYFLRQITVKCSKMTNLTGTATFEWRSGFTTLSTQVLVCTDGNSNSRLSFQPYSADNWTLTLNIDGATQRLAECPASGVFPAGTAESARASCAAGSAKILFTLARGSTH